MDQAETEKAIAELAKSVAEFQTLINDKLQQSFDRVEMQVTALAKRIQACEEYSGISDKFVSLDKFESGHDHSDGSSSRATFWNGLSNK